MVKPEVKLKAILEITRNLSTELQIDKVAPRILDSLMELFPQAERLFLILVDPETKRLVRKAFRCRPARRSQFTTTIPADEAQVSISRSIVNHVLVQKKAVLSQDASMDKNLPTSASIADLKIRSVMCVPLLTPDSQVLGILQLDTSDRKQFHQEDLDVLTAVASQAAIAIQNATLHESLLERERLDRDLKLAEQVQKRFLPQSVPELPGFEFFAHYDPAYEVGGDYYDFVQLPGNRFAIAVGDVSGKGVAAALMMAKFSGDTRYCILTENSPGAATSELNHLLFAAGIDEKFITLSLSVLDVDRRTLALSSAGHPPIMVRRASGRIEEFGEDVAGFPLGIIPGSEYGNQETRLQPGDVAVVYSDGVTDARNLREELYHTRDNPRLSRRVAETSGGPEAVGRAILQEIREYLGRPRSGGRHHPGLLRPRRHRGRPPRPGLNSLAGQASHPRLFWPLPDAERRHVGQDQQPQAGARRSRGRPPRAGRAPTGTGPPGPAPPEDSSQEPRCPTPRRPPLHVLCRGRSPRRCRPPRPGSAPPRCSALPGRAVRLARARLSAASTTGPSSSAQAPPACFAGYLLAQHGYRPLLLERGRAVKERVADVRRFDAGGPLDPESNYLFGEGGAGTFSDGKLTSRTTGPDVTRVLEILADCHGKPSIVYEHRPHLGSNRLPLVVRTLRRKLEEMGGEVRFSCRVDDLDLADGQLRGLFTSSGYLPAAIAVLAVGHSARDTYGMLLRRGVPLEPKAFQFGVRIEQPQEQIDAVRYGACSGHPSLGAADYGLSVRAGNRDLFTFCMCAGGYVMPSVSEPGYFCTNGMSESRHDSPFANSGLVVTIDPAETGSLHPLAGVHFQQRYERLAYLVAGRTYAAPIQWVRDFLRARPSRGRLPSSYCRGTTFATDLNACLPEKVAETLVRGLPIMDRRFQGLFLETGHPHRPGGPRQLPGPDPPRSRLSAKPRNRRTLPLRRGGRLRRRNHQRSRRRPAHSPGDRGHSRTAELITRTYRSSPKRALHQFLAPLCGVFPRS